MTLSRLEIVSGSEFPKPPYPADIRSSGWKFSLDTTRLRQSDTWTLARPELRPWLLMLWMVAWEQAPCGTLPADDNLIGALLGIEAAMFVSHRSILLRGWARCADGRLYHPVITELVREMLRLREMNRKRQKAHRNALLTRESHVSNDSSGSKVVEVKKVKHKDQSQRLARATRLPADWRLPDEWKQEAVDTFHLEPSHVVRISLAFKDYWIAKSGANACKLDWQATFRNWLRKETGNG